MRAAEFKLFAAAIVSMRLESPTGADLAVCRSGRVFCPYLLHKKDLQTSYRRNIRELQ